MTRFVDGRRRRTRSDGQDGSVSIEAAIVFAVVMVTFFTLMIAAGRILSSETQVRSAAHAAARAASLEATFDEAAAAATTTGRANLSDAGVVCTEEIPSIEVISTAARFVPGGWVQVRIACTPDVLPFGLAATEYSYDATEVIDQYRSEP